MTQRILPRDEYYKLRDTYLAPIAAALPSSARVIVVEEGETIVATWALLFVPHVEGVWTHPDYRKSAAVVRHLVTGMRAELRESGVDRVYTAAVDDEVRKLLQHFGAEKLPGDHYVMEATLCPSE